MVLCQAYHKLNSIAISGHKLGESILLYIELTGHVHISKSSSGKYAIVLLFEQYTLTKCSGCTFVNQHKDEEIRSTVVSPSSIR